MGLDCLCVAYKGYCRWRTSISVQRCVYTNAIALRRMHTQLHENALLFIQQKRPDAFVVTVVSLLHHHHHQHCHHRHSTSCARQRNAFWILPFGIFPKLCTIQTRRAREHFCSFNFIRQNKLSTFNMRETYKYRQQRDRKPSSGNSSTGTGTGTVTATAHGHPVHLGNGECDLFRND